MLRLGPGWYQRLSRASSGISHLLYWYVTDNLPSVIHDLLLIFISNFTDTKPLQSLPPHIIFVQMTSIFCFLNPYTKEKALSSPFTTGVVMFSWALPVTLKHMLDHSECLGGTAQFGGLAELKDREHFYVRESKKKKKPNDCTVYESQLSICIRFYCTETSAAVLSTGAFCSTMQFLIQTWATARACLTWWPRCSPRSRMKATPSGALSASWRTPSSSARHAMKTWRGSW